MDSRQHCQSSTLESPIPSKLVVPQLAGCVKMALDAIAKRLAASLGKWMALDFSLI